jgi:hypothetical protein
MVKAKIGDHLTNGLDYNRSENCSMSKEQIVKLVEDILGKKLVEPKLSRWGLRWSGISINEQELEEELI